MNSRDDVVLVERWLARRRRPVDLSFFGYWFAGRPGESPQTPRSCRGEGNTLVIEFAPTERLTIIEPDGTRIGEEESDGATLIIPTARQATFGWHYYGRERTPENWCEETYIDRGVMLEIVRTGPLMPGRRLVEKRASLFIELA